MDQAERCYRLEYDNEDKHDNEAGSDVERQQRVIVLTSKIHNFKTNDRQPANRHPPSPSCHEAPTNTVLSQTP